MQLLIILLGLLPLSFIDVMRLDSYALLFAISGFIAVLIYCHNHTKNVLFINYLSIHTLKIRQAAGNATNSARVGEIVAIKKLYVIKSLSKIYTRTANHGENCMPKTK